MSDLLYTDKVKIFELISDKIDTIKDASTECFELIYKAAYNEAIDAAVLAMQNSPDASAAITNMRKLKK